MSTRALTHVFYNVHVRPAAKLVLLAIADTADDDGDNAWPSIATLARKATLHPRSVQRAINELVKLGLLTVRRNGGPPGTNYYRIHMPAVDRPGDNLVDNPVDAAVDNHRHPVDRGVAERHPGNLPGVTDQVDRGGNVSGRGDTSATRTSNRTQEPNPRAQARARPARTGTVDKAPRDDEGRHLELDARRVLTELGPDWRLSPRQVDALVPATQTALRSGWAVDELITHLSARPDGVRSPAAVLTTRLRDAANHAHPVSRLQSGSVGMGRRPWCGDQTCDPVTRIRDPGGDPPERLYRCPICHPTAPQP